MYEEMMDKLEKTKMEFCILKNHLNHDTLQKTLLKMPRILVLNCHGTLEGDSSKIWVEDVNLPSLVD
jgi:hypothetical protein